MLLIFTNPAIVRHMYSSKIMNQIQVENLDDRVIVDIFDDLVLDGLELFLREKKSPFPFEFSSLQEARDYMSMSIFVKREYLKNIFKEQQSILEFHEQNPELHYDSLSSLNVPRVLRKCLRLVHEN